MMFEKPTICVMANISESLFLVPEESHKEGLEYLSYLIPNQSNPNCMMGSNASFFWFSFVYAFC
jgi:hypothetical protein